MRAGKSFTAFLIVCVLAFAFNASAAEVVIGAKGNLQPGKNLKEAIKLLGGLPDSITIHRGPETSLDSLEFRFPKHDLILRALNNGNKVEAIEIGPNFKGKFDSNVRLGDKFSKIVSKYGVPKTMTSQMARYPDIGTYFLMNADTLLSAKVFLKDTTLVHAKMMNPK